MSFAKPESKREPIDEVQKLMCSVKGCTKRWSVDMGRPMCSQHQWGHKTKVELKDIAALLPVSAPIKHWTDEAF